jgi:8-amino-7-oxononanoate synthase
MIQRAQKYLNFISRRKAELTYRKLPDYASEYLDFSSNDYLGLSQNGNVINGGIETANKYGAGSSGSRLLSGNKPIFEEFETLIARDKKSDGALIFSSGFQANSGMIDCLSDKDTVIVFDKLNHASMYHGAFASQARLLRYNHLDYDHLESILKSVGSENILIASETIFGMDGDVADISVLANLAYKFGALLYLDEAHATGLYGPRGYGLSTNFDLPTDSSIIMGTFSKALGSQGAYVACSNLVKDYVIQKCRSFIYSTALSPFCLGASMTAWKMIDSLESVRTSLLAKSESLRRLLLETFCEEGGVINGIGTNIIPIIYKNARSMLQAKEQCLSGKIVVSGIAQPTSPTPRIRIAVNANHSDNDIMRLAEALS